ncbi:rCG58408 [Rattus norvegicus]|uniref:RCG58408 n=1 Tax=Rattus norvegicus TaxID=10116 RepID=A6J4P0_RAT|nr:rCG58408 [Rattus norvegicus]
MGGCVVLYLGSPRFPHLVPLQWKHIAPHWPHACSAIGTVFRKEISGASGEKVPGLWPHRTVIKHKQEVQLLLQILPSPDALPTVSCQQTKNTSLMSQSSCTLKNY